jgi:hypothetical protein
MRERDDHPRTQCANIGYEDMRIFRTDKGGLQGIAASLHLERARRPADGGAHNQPPEQVVVSFDAEYNIVAARPIRGDWWSGTAQKNWVPFDDCAEPRFLYSIAKGTMFDDQGAVHGDAVRARPSTQALPLLNARPQAAPSPSPSLSLEDRERQEREEREAREKQELMEARERQRKREEREERESRRAKPDLHLRTSTGSAPVRGRRVSHDSVTTRPSYTVSRPSSAHAANAASSRPYHIHTANTESGSRVLGTGRVLMPKYEGLRGGTQLVRVADDAWLGIGHEMKFLNNLKFYWHTFYLVDSKGRMKSASPPCKLAPEGIEFAAGMAIDGDRVVISFGVDDMECRIAETSLSAVMDTLRPVEH